MAGFQVITEGTGMQVQFDHEELDKARVRFRLDDGKPINQLWGRSADGTAVFSLNPGMLTKQLTATNTLLFEFSPFEQRATTIKFDLSGMAAEVKPFAKACGVKL